MIAIYIVDRKKHETSTFLFATSEDAHYAIKMFAGKSADLKLINKGLESGVVVYANDRFFFRGYKVESTEVHTILALESQPHPNLYPAFYELKREIAKQVDSFETREQYEAELASATIEKVNTILFAMENAACCDDWYTTDDYWWSEVLSDFIRPDELEKSEKDLTRTISTIEAVTMTEIELGNRIRFAECRLEIFTRVNDLAWKDYWFEELHHRLADLDAMREYASN